jgi:hypothetical protein
VSPVAAAGLLVAVTPTSAAATLAQYTAWLAGLWLVLALLTGWAVVFTGAQVAAVLAVFAGVLAGVGARDWYVAARHPWLDPWFLQAQGLALAGFCLVLGVVRSCCAGYGASRGVRDRRARRPFRRQSLLSAVVSSGSIGGARWWLCL